MSSDLWNFQSRLCLAVGQKPNMRHLIREMLHGVSLTSLEFVADIHAAPAILAAAPYDIILLEVNEPVAAAIGFIEAVRKAKKPINCALSIIVSHAQLEEGSVEKLRDAGITELLAIPVSRKNLLEAMDVSLKRPRQFIRVSSYIGPDRRRGQASDYVGPKRREIDRLGEQLAEAREKTEKRALAERRADVELVSFLCDTSIAETEERMANDAGFSAFLCEGSQEEAHFTDMIDLDDGELTEEASEEMLEDLPEEDVPVEEEGAMTQAELASRLNKRPGGGR